MVDIAAASNQAIVSVGDGPAKVYYLKPPAENKLGMFKRKNSKSIIRKNNNEPLKERGKNILDNSREELDDSTMKEIPLTTDHNSSQFVTDISIQGEKGREKIGNHSRT